MNAETMLDAEKRMDLSAAITAGRLGGSPGTERTVYDPDTDEPVVSYWPVVGGGFDARWHRREAREHMNGDYTDDGSLGTRALSQCYYSSHEEFEVEE